MKYFIGKYEGLQWVPVFCLDLFCIINGLLWSRTICYNQKQVHSSSLWLFWTKLKKRFLDDCFIFLRLSIVMLKKLLDVLNNINPAIQFIKWYPVPIYWYYDKLRRKKDFYGYLFKAKIVKKICLLQMKSPQALLKKHSIFFSLQNLHDYYKRLFKKIKLKQLETLILERHYPERVIKAGIKKL